MTKTLVAMIAVSLALTLVLYNSSSVYLVGLPVFIYALYPMGIGALIMEVFILTFGIVFLLYFVGKRRFGYLWQILILIAVISLNKYFGDRANIDLSGIFLFNN